MIEARCITKTFGTVTALNDLTCQIPNGSVFGLIGSNGAGKSTFLRLLAGILRQDKGYLMIDGHLSYDNPAVKSRVFYIPDQNDFLGHYEMKDLIRFYKFYYPRFSDEVYGRLAKQFPVDTRQRLSQMSKGMQRQVMLMIGLSCQTDYLLLDESFDGLDPLVRQLLRRLLAETVADRGQTVVIATHNLRELEDLCDHIGLLHQGTLLLEKELDALKMGLHKIQAVFSEPTTQQDLTGLDILKYQTRGTLAEIVARGEREQVLAALKQREMVFYEALPLTLEEIFLQEMEVAGYDIRSLVG